LRHPAAPPIVGRPRRRTFTARDKLRILRRDRPGRGTGDIGAILRREGFYSRLVRLRRQPRCRSVWRADAGQAWSESSRAQPARGGSGLVAGRTTPSHTALVRAGNAIIEVQKKTCAICWASRWRPMATCLDQRVVDLSPAGGMTAVCAGSEFRGPRCIGLAAFYRAPFLSSSKSRPARALTERNKRSC